MEKGLVSFPLDGFTEVENPLGRGNELHSGCGWLGRTFQDNFHSGLCIRSHVTQRVITFQYIGHRLKDGFRTDWVFMLDEDEEIDVRVRVVRVTNDVS